MNQTTLNGFITVCSECRSIKIAPQTWLSRQDNSFYYDRLDALYREDERSHGYCPECLENLKSQIPNGKRGFR
jgi:hypothetical protein